MATIDRRDPRALTLIARILHGSDRSESTYRDIQQLAQNLGTLDLFVYAPEIRQQYGLNTTFTTPLIAAILRGSQPLIQFLINAGADINFGGGLTIGTPLDYAIYTNKPLLADLLREHEAVAEQPLALHPQEQLHRQQFLTYHPRGPEFYQAQARFPGFQQQRENIGFYQAGSRRYC